MRAQAARPWSPASLLLILCGRSQQPSQLQVNLNVLELQGNSSLSAIQSLVGNKCVTQLKFDAPKY